MGHSRPAGREKTPVPQEGGEDAHEERPAWLSAQLARSRCGKRGCIKSLLIHCLHFFLVPPPPPFFFNLNKHHFLSTTNLGPDLGLDSDLKKKWSNYSNCSHQNTEIVTFEIANVFLSWSLLRQIHFNTIRLSEENKHDLYPLTVLSSFLFKFRGRV